MLYIYFQTKITFRDQHKNQKLLGGHLTPKSVWLCHYEHLVEDLGPLSLMETNIAEKKNGEMRKFSTKANQTKNVLKTISTRYMCTNNANVKQSLISNAIEIKSIVNQVKTSARYCYNTHNNFYFFHRELNREAVKTWTESMDREAKNDNAPMELKLKLVDRRALKASGVGDLTNLTVIKHIKRFGYTFKSKDGQVIIHGRNEKCNFAEILYILQKKGTQSVFLLVQDLDVTFAEHLGVHVCTRTCSQSLLQFDDLISSCPLNMYNAVNHLDETLLYVVAHEALVHK